MRMEPAISEDLSSAINRNDILVTEDEDIHDVWEKREFQELLQTINPEFKIQTVKDVFNLTPAIHLPVKTGSFLVALIRSLGDRSTGCPMASSDSPLYTRP